MNRILYFDTETTPLAPMATDYPEFVAMGWRDDSGLFRFTQEPVEYCRDMIRAHIAEGYLLAGHNLAFDFGVLGIGIMELDGARVHDTMVVDMYQRLARHDCSREKPGPPKLSRLDELSPGLAGKGTVQLTFRPGQSLTPEQIDYLRGDIECLPRIVERQRRGEIPGGYQLVTRQVQANMALMQLGFTGLRIDRAEIARQREVFSRARRRAARVLQGHGVYRPARTGPKGGRYKASVDTGRLKEHILEVCKEHKIAVSRTDKGSVKTDKAFLLGLPQTDIIQNYLDYKNYEKLINTFLRAWDTEHGRIYPRYRGMMRTGRTSSHGPNLQQVPSRGDKGKLKKVFLPEEGMSFFEIDFGQIELCALAELTHGVMRQLINEGRDLHKYAASMYFGKEESEVSKTERQLMKCANYGLPGGMGQETFRQFIRSNGLPDPGEQAAVDLKNAWLAAFPEMEDWLRGDSVFPAWVRRMILDKQSMTESGMVKINERYEELLGEGRYIPQYILRAINKGEWKERGYSILKWLKHEHVKIRRGHVRRPVSYTEQRNTRFQGLTALLCKRALCRVMGLSDVVVNAFVHDSVLISCKSHDEAMAAGEAMLDAAKEYLPTVRVSVDICGPGDNWYEAKCAEERTISRE
jgi:hypothetical protein